MASLLSILSRGEDLTSTLHEIFDEDNDDQLFCFACVDLVIGCPTYILEPDDDDNDTVYMHKSCAELPGKIQHPLHPQHTLKIRDRLRYGFICDGCRHVSFGLIYRCKECKFKLDLQCASKNEGQALKEIVERGTIYHPHKLQHVYFYSSMPTYPSDDDSDDECPVCCCSVISCLDGRDPTYTCNVCLESEKPFFIHKSCLDRLPRQVQSSFHPEHPLFTRRLLDDDEYNCGLCDGEITGFALACDECHIEFHVSCGSRTTRGLRLEFHDHDMYYVISGSPDLQPCTLCKAGCEGAFFRCVKCDVNVHMECIPLPEIVEHESHEYHPLKLTDSVVTHRDDDDEYRCDICEEEGNIKHHSYYCKECNFIAHIECVHSHEDDTSETKDAEVETGDADVENDDAEKMSNDEVHDSEDDWDISLYGRSNSEHSSDGQQYDKSDVDVGIVNITRKIEELALQLEAVATSDKRIENVKADMEGLVFQLEDLRNKLIKRRYY